MIGHGNLLRGLFASSLIGFTVAANAQDVVGTAVIAGERVELLSDQTWRFVDPAAVDSNCKPVNAVVSFCGAPRWSATGLPTPDFSAAYRQTDRSYGGVIFEGLGTSSGMTQEFMRNALLQYAAQATGVSVDQIPVIESKTISVDDVPAERLSYSLNLGGLDVVYQNTVIVTENETIQLLVWTIGKTFGDAERSVADEFVSHVRLNIEK